ncbi:MAG: TetR/AcrR family transcriptional regulator [Oscillibacter sp.]|jgi:AcrR family transcriptional regulator|nr:TetR/AcrR family transcriptional regulator [Oscillibacter sp.]
MKQETTKDRILLSALDLFSQYGYEAVSVEQIATAVGIKAPSLYKHYKSKQDIFNAIFAEMQRRYDEQTEKMDLHLADAAADKNRFSKITCDTLVKEVQDLIGYSLHDECVSRFRRLMTIEQFRSPEISALYTQRYVDRLVQYHERLFAGLIHADVMKNGDIHSMALQYVCPILISLSVCDRQPELEAQAMSQIDAHIRQFMSAYHTDLGRAGKAT